MLPFLPIAPDGSSNRRFQARPSLRWSVRTGLTPNDSWFALSAILVLFAMFANLTIHYVVAADPVVWSQADRLNGSPDAPLPLIIEPAFPQIVFKDPMHVRWQPHLQRYCVCELAGKLWSFTDTPNSSAELMIDFKATPPAFDAERIAGVDSVYSIAFDPNFASNRFIYVFMVLKAKQGKAIEDGSLVARFTVTDEQPPRINITSQLNLITWLSGGHNGCDLDFDGQGNLLISTGDATDPSPPDQLKTGQNINDLLSSILRIDVRGATPAKPYRIPEDNPFQNIPDARPEVWAYGLRNPWRISYDPISKQLWTGDVGWEKWELVHRIERGGNYGWSVREGNELLQPNATVGPTPIIPPVVELPHSDAASVTGGFVYHGSAIAQLRGKYLFGDWITGRVWAVATDGSGKFDEVASDRIRIIAFSPDRNGEPLVVNHLAQTSLYRLVPNPNYEQLVAQSRNFPRLLSQTGLYADLAKKQPAQGVHEYSINQPQWLDGLTSQHHFALADNKPIIFYNDPVPVGSVAMFNSRLHYPPGATLVKTIGIPNPESPASIQRFIETQILRFDGHLWTGLSYVWNDEQTDAELAPPSGMEVMVDSRTGQKHRIHSRSECFQCHNPWPEVTLSFSPEQLHRPELKEQSPLLQLVEQGYVQTLDKQRKAIPSDRCVRKPLTARADAALADRARSYLHTNCSHCHQFGAGAAVDLSLKIADAPPAMKAIDVTPLKGNFGLPECKLIPTGDATRSAMLYRMASNSVGRMPHIGSREVDFEAVALVSQWIDSMKSENDKEKTENTPAIELAREIISECERLNAHGASDRIDSTSSVDRQPVVRQKAMQLAIELAKHRSHRQTNHSEAKAHSLLDHEWIKRLATVNDPIIASLFEAHLPANERQRHLDMQAIYADIADLTGDASAGSQMYFDLARSQCSKCHRIGDRGGMIGPDLSKIGAKLSAAQLFEAIADPNRVIEQKFQTHTIVLDDGRVLTGLLTSETPQALQITNSQGEIIQVQLDTIETRRLDKNSLMPSGLLQSMTAQQAADLIAFLSQLK